MKQKTDKYSSINKLKDKLFELAVLEAEKLSKYNRNVILKEDLKPKIPHKNIYGLLFGNDSNNKSLKAITECITHGVDFTVKYPITQVKYKIVNNAVIKTTRTQDFLTPLEVCFIEDVNINELLELINNKQEKREEKETFSYLF